MNSDNTTPVECNIEVTVRFIIPLFVSPDDDVNDLVLDFLEDQVEFIESIQINSIAEAYQ